MASCFSKKVTGKNLFGFLHHDVKIPRAEVSGAPELPPFASLQNVGTLRNSALQSSPGMDLVSLATLPEPAV